MGFSYYSDSQTFFEISSETQVVQFNSLQGRLLCLKDFFKKMAILPFALLYKAYKTLIRAGSLLVGTFLLVLTLGTSIGTRKFFVDRIEVLAKDLADWILLPFAVAVSFFRLVLAFLIHPNFYFSC